MKKMLIGAAALAALMSVPAAAQFTAVVAPPKPKVDPAVVAEAPAVVARRDSVARVTMTNMKDWVDSAAAALGVAASPVAADTQARPTGSTPPLATPARPDTARQVPPANPRATTEFREGAPAPNTASPLPLIALLGAIALSSGLWMLRPKTAPDKRA